MSGHGAGHVAIVGGGPAGAQCARALAERGVRVTLFEPRHGHEKPCGGGLPARAFDRYPFLADPRLPARRIGSCLVIAPSGREAVFELADPIRVVSRADLHRFMIDRAVAAGATRIAGRVLTIDRTGGVWWLGAAAEGHAPERRGPFDFLVAADGAAGSCRRRLAGAPARGGSLAQGIGFHLPGPVEDRIVLRFHERLHGYLWVFPRLDHASAGICATLGSRSAAGLRALLETDLRARYGAAALAAARPYAALIPGAPAAPDGTATQGEGWALAGDAGDCVDPLTREGIYHAMRSGDLLAAALAAGRPREYAAAWAREAAPDLAWAAGHSAGFFSTPFIERLVRLCGASATVARVMSDLIAGRQPYRRLKARLVLNAPRIGWELLAGATARRRRNAPPADRVSRDRDS
jgi:flavin-dependent dehydrogenase